MRWKFLLFALLTVTAGAQELPPDRVAITGTLKVTVTPAVAEPYTMIRVLASSVDDFKNFDLMILTSYKGTPYFVDSIETKVKGEFVFTGPPGTYTIRMTGFHLDKGFVTTNAVMTIKGKTDGGVAPVDPEEPPPPPTPVDPNTPSTGPPPEGYFGFGPLVYNQLLKDRPKVAGVNKLLDNFIWASDAKSNDLKKLIADLKARNETVYAENKDLESLKKVWTEHANRLIDNGIIKPSLKDHQQAYRETAAGIKAALGK